MMPVVHPEKDWDKTGWIAMFMADWLRVEPVVQQFCQRTALGDLEWLCTLRIIGTCR